MRGVAGLTFPACSISESGARDDPRTGLVGNATTLKHYDVSSQLCLRRVHRWQVGLKPRSVVTVTLIRMGMNVLLFCEAFSSSGKWVASKQVLPPATRSPGEGNLSL